MVDPRMVARNSAIMAVAGVTLLGFILWHLLGRMPQRSSALVELAWWITGLSLTAFGMMTVLVMVFR